MSGTTIVVHRDYRPSWQLGPPPAAGHLALVEWRMDKWPVDSGPTDEVAAVLAEAMVAVGRVTFPSFTPPPPRSVDDWWPSGPDLVLAICPNPIEWLVAKTRSVPVPLVLVSTASTDRVLGMFDMDYYSWCLQSQFALLSAHDAPPPVVDKRQVFDLCSDEWTAVAASLAPAGVLAALRPGVDGDMAGLWSRDAGVEGLLLAALAQACAVAGVGFKFPNESANSRL